MLKEIYEQPTSLRQTLHGRIDGNDIALEEFPPGSFEDIDSIQFVACGTSFHAGMYGEGLLSGWGLDASTYIASEYAAYPVPVDENTLVIGVTQSGETADTLEAPESARAQRLVLSRTLLLPSRIMNTASIRHANAISAKAGIVNVVMTTATAPRTSAAPTATGTLFMGIDDVRHSKYLHAVNRFKYHRCIVIRCKPRSEVLRGRQLEN
jgi:glucosamine--fructose-6-phosphate aminotransferase (isomerizing)